MARRRRFCTAAASVNSSVAPLMPRSRKRSRFRMRLRWANNISTFLRSWRERTYAGVVAIRRATSRAASWTLRAILRNAVFGQHLAFIGQATQSVCLDRKIMVLALVTCERSFLKARHSLRNALPAGQQYSSASSFQWKSLLEKLSFLRSVLSHTGTCGSMSFSSNIQASIDAVP
ncbi:hypothetical protein SAMN03159342_04871 [Pseudomonas sp. NFPP04]|nr:hypothetical protein SAMN03159342_04871 [Pseudomonas sp. NFPP04]SFJ88012.1 hypothetical protein SAMN03159344_04875 [Pseudomonas sp. NFPP11]